MIYNGKAALTEPPDPDSVKSVPFESSLHEADPALDSYTIWLVLHSLKQGSTQDSLSTLNRET